MMSPPPCASVGAHCRELKVTLRIAELRDDGPAFHDAIGTWLLGHRQRITFGDPYVAGDRLLVDATIHVACRYLDAGGPSATQSATCSAHGMNGRVPAESAGRPHPAATEDGRHVIMQERRLQDVALAPKPRSRRPLPTLDGPNPCSGAPCRTADNRRGAACCRDLTIETVIDHEDVGLEALLRARRSPYVCKVTRVDDDIVECEVISACHYLGGDDLSCVLHGLSRPDGNPAKPSICSDWPATGPDAVYHPGCRLAPAAPTS